MSQWQKLVSTTIKAYASQIESDLANRLRILNIMRGPNRKPYVAPPDNRTPAQKLKDKQADCRHDFSKTDKTQRRCACKNCGLRVSQSFAVGYQDAYEKGRDDGAYNSGDEE